MKNLIVNGKVYHMAAVGHLVASKTGSNVLDEKFAGNDPSGVSRAEKALKMNLAVFDWIVD